MNDKETSEIVVEPVKKKRGRKPKVKDNKIKATISNSFDSKNVLQNINTSNIDNPCILHLNVTNIENDTMNNDISRLDSHSFETAFCEYNPDISEPLFDLPAVGANNQKMLVRRHSAFYSQTK